MDSFSPTGILVTENGWVFPFQISWSGCEDGQTSADTFRGGVAVGAMSYVCCHFRNIVDHILTDTFP